MKNNYKIMIDPYLSDSVEKINSQNYRRSGGKNNYVMFNRGTIWTENEIKITAVKAEHSDAYAIGVIIDGGEKNIT